jgi:hypothetical protein
MDIFKIRSLTASSLGDPNPRTAQIDKPRQLAVIFPEQFTVSRKRRPALALYFDASPDGKPFHTLPGIAPAERKRGLAGQ